MHSCLMTLRKEEAGHGVSVSFSGLYWLLLVNSVRKLFNRTVSFSTGSCWKYSPIIAVMALMTNCYTFESAEARHSRNDFSQRFTTRFDKGKPLELIKWLTAKRI